MINYSDFLNKDLVNVKPSGIRKFFAIAEEMENVIKLSVPLTVDLNVGKSWYDAK